MEETSVPYRFPWRDRVAVRLVKGIAPLSFCVRSIAFGRGGDASTDRAANAVEIRSFTLSAMKIATKKGHWFQFAAMLSTPSAIAAGTGAALLGTGALAAAVALWHACETQQHLDIQQKTELEAATLKLELQAGVQDRIQLLASIAKRYATQGTPLKKDWQADAAFYLDSCRGCAAIALADLSFQKPWIAPESGLSTANPLVQQRFFEAIASSKKPGQIAVSRSFDWGQGEQAFLASVPLSEQIKTPDKNPISSKNQPRQSFIIGIFQTRELFESILRSHQARGYAIAIFDRNQQPIYQHNYDSTRNEQWKREETLEFYGVKWRIFLKPQADLLDRVRSQRREILWSAGSAIGALLIAAVYLAHRTSRRALEVEKINRQLQQALQHSATTEEALRESEERYRRLVELSPEAILLHCEGKIIYANPAATELFGAARLEELIGLEIWDFVQPDCLELVRERVKRVCEENKQNHFVVQKLVRLDKLVIDAEVIGTPVSYGGKTAVLAIVRDITERLRASRALKESEERFRAIAEAIPLPVVISRASDGVVLYGNSQLAAAFGVSVENLVGLKTPDFYNNPDDRRILLERIFENGYLRNCEVQVKKADGTPFWVIVSVQPLSFNGDRALLCAFYDITERKSSEQALWESQQQYQSLVNTIDGIVWEADVQTAQFTFVSQQAETLLGYPLDSWIGEPNFWPDRIHPDDRKWAIEFCLKSSQQKPDYEFEYRMMAADGRVVWLRDIVRVIFENDRPVKLRGIMLDITAHKQALEALRESEERWQLALRGNNDGIWDWNIKTDEVFFSPRWKEMLGYEDGEISNHLDEWKKRVHPDDLEEVMQLIQDHFAKKTPFYISEHRMSCKDGSYKWILDRGQALWDEQGNLVRMAGSHTDITDRKRAEEELREISISLENAVEGIARLDVRGRYVAVNRAYAITIGYKPEETLGLEWQDTIHPEDRQKMLAAYQFMLNAGKVEVETRGLRKDGSVFYKQLVMTKACDRHKNFIGHYCFVKDITERKLAEAALRESEQRYRSVIETAAEGIVLLSADGSISACNCAAERILGISAGQMMLRASLATPLRAIHEDGSPFPSEIHPASVTLRTGEPQSNVVMGIRKQDAAVTWISVNTRPLFRADESAPYGVVFSFFDITERKQAEEVLRLSDEVLKQMPDSTVLADLSGNICKWMGKSEQIFGYAVSEVIGKPIHLLYRSDIRESVFAKILKGIHEEGVFCGEIACVKKDGSEFSVETTAKTFYDRVGQPLFIICTNRDVTDRKRAEADIQRANEQLTIRVNELEERHEEIILLSQMSNLLQSCITIEEACKVIAQIVPLLFPNNSGALFAIANSRNLVEAITVWGSPTSQMLFATPDCIALRGCQPHLMEDTSTGLTCKHLYLDSFPSSYFCIPLMAQGEAMGVLYLSYLEKGLLTKAKQHLAVAVARHISLALANLKLHETLQQQSIRDPLTGLFNRRYLEESLTREIRRAARSQQSVGIVMLDVDHFKQFNDTFGHEAGDAVLRELGMFLHNNIRGGDIACRYGGEEFTLILPEASVADTKRRAEQLRSDVKHLNVQYRRQPLGAIALSLGVACFPEHGETGEALIRSADAALYRAKAQGRDRVVVASSFGNG